MSETVQLSKADIEALLASLKEDAEKLSGFEAAKVKIKIAGLESRLVEMEYKIPSSKTLDSKELKELTEKAAKAESNAADRSKWMMKIVELIL